MAVREYTPAELAALLTESAYGDGQWLAESLATLSRILGRGDKIAVYQNEDLGHPECGHRQYVSYGSAQAQLETDEPPVTLPDTPRSINWRYQLQGVLTHGSLLS